MKTRVPSLARLVKSFPSLSPETLKVIREKLGDGCKLGDVDKLFGSFGVEYIRNARDGIVAAYLNTGHAYSPTLLRRAGRTAIELTTLGDFVESHERRNARLP